jgi:hypothetical protein
VRGIYASPEAGPARSKVPACVRLTDADAGPMFMEKWSMCGCNLFSISSPAWQIHSRVVALVPSYSGLVDSSLSASGL